MRYALFFIFLLAYCRIYGQEGDCPALKQRVYSFNEADTGFFTISDFIDTAGIIRIAGAPRVQVRKLGAEGVYVTRYSSDSIIAIPQKDFHGSLKVTLGWGMHNPRRGCEDTITIRVKRIADARYDSLHTNQLTAVVKNTGTFFNDKVRSGFMWGDERLPMVGSSALWVGGYDENGVLHASYKEWDYGEQFNQNYIKGYVPGLDALNDSSAREDTGYIWHLEKTVLDRLAKRMGPSDYESLWPVERIKWNAYLNLDEDSSYSANTDLPCLLGDEMVYANFTDRYNHDIHDSDKVGVDVRMKLFAYEGNEIAVLNNTVFVRYYITNISDHDYHDFVMGVFMQPAVGYLYDNMVGCDTVLNAYYAYNGDNYDDGHFGKNPPAVGYTFLNRDLYAFRSYWGDFAIQGYPRDKEDYFHYLNGRHKGGLPQYLGGLGTYPHPNFDSKTTRYYFPGDVLDTVSTNNWTEISAGSNSGFRTVIGSAYPIEFKKGETVQFDIAITVSQEEGKNHLENVAVLKSDIGAVREYYEKSGFSCYNPVEDLIPNEKEVSVFPTLTKGYLNVFSPTASEFTIYHTNGRLIQNGTLRQGVNYIDIEDDLAQGIYIIQVLDGDDWKPFKFYKIPN